MSQNSISLYQNYSKEYIKLSKFDSKPFMKFCILMLIIPFLLGLLTKQDFHRKMEKNSIVRYADCRHSLQSLVTYKQKKKSM